MSIVLALEHVHARRLSPPCRPRTVRQRCAPRDTVYRRRGFAPGATKSWQLLRSAGRAACARTHFGCAGMRWDAPERASVDERKRACACGSSPMGVRASTTRRSAVMYYICRTASRRRDAESARLPVLPAVGVGRTMRALCRLCGSVRSHRQMPVPRVAVQPGILVQWV